MNYYQREAFNRQVDRIEREMEQIRWMIQEQKKESQEIKNKNKNKNNK